MDFSRIDSAIDVERKQAAKIAVIGNGASAGLSENLVRSGAGRLLLFDIDRVGAENLCRQHHDADMIGLPKVDAVAARLRRVNPDVEVHTFTDDITQSTPSELDELFRHVDLIINATDRFQVAAFGNQLALQFNIPALWVGLYPQAGAGEVIFWHPGIDACYRCLCEKRYRLHAQAAAAGRSLDPPSDGCTIFDVTLIDGIAGIVAIGLLTRGADIRFGRLVEQLGDRNFIQIQLDPLWLLNGRNPVKSLLNVPEDNPHFFSWNTIVRADPDGGRLPCPDCEQYRGHGFAQGANNQWFRMIPTPHTPTPRTGARHG